MNPFDHLKNFFDAVYCINLDRRPDRWERFQSQMPADWPFRPIQRVAAMDGRRVPPPAWWSQGGGAWGCYRSHVQIIEQALNTGLRSLLILEDDALFDPQFTEKAVRFVQELPPDWGMVYLGGQHLFVDQHPPLRISPLVYRPYNVNRTHAYALRGPMIQRVYHHLMQQNWEPKDHIDHHLGRFHQTQKSAIYCPANWLVGQMEGDSNISGRHAPIRFWPHAAEVCKTLADDQIFVAVLGLHSSGSSCLAGVLHHLGLHLGNKLTGYYGNDPAKNQCGFEAAGLRDLCEAAIPFPSTDLKLPSDEIERCLGIWIHQACRDASGKNTIAAGKYPMLCRLGDQLRRVCGENLRIIVADRPFEESVNSLQRRCPKLEAKQIHDHQRWLEDGKQELLQLIPGNHQLTVCYSHLLQNPEWESHKIADFLGLSITKDRINAVRNWVDSGKRHVDLRGKGGPSKKPTEVAMPESWQDLMNGCRRSGQYMVAAFHIDHEQLHLARINGGFHPHHFHAALELLKDNLTEESVAARRLSDGVQFHKHEA